MIDYIVPTTFDSLITKHSNISEKPITISQVVQKMNSNRPTIRALQKAGRLTEKQKALVGHEDNRDRQELEEGLAEQLQAEASTSWRTLSTECTHDNKEVEVSIRLVSRSGRRSRMTKKAMNAESTL